MQVLQMVIKHTWYKIFICDNFTKVYLFKKSQQKFSISLLKRQ